MKATKIHEFSNGGIVAKLGNQNVYLIEVDNNLYAYWTLPPYGVPQPISKDDIEWN